MAECAGREERLSLRLEPEDPQAVVAMVEAIRSLGHRWQSGELTTRETEEELMALGLISPEIADFFGESDAPS